MVWADQNDPNEGIETRRACGRAAGRWPGADQNDPNEGIETVPAAKPPAGEGRGADQNDPNEGIETLLARREAPQGRPSGQIRTTPMRGLRQAQRARASRRSRPWADQNDPNEGIETLLLSLREQSTPVDGQIRTTPMRGLRQSYRAAGVMWTSPGRSERPQ